MKTGESPCSGEAGASIRPRLRVVHRATSSASKSSWPAKAAAAEVNPQQRSADDRIVAETFTCTSCDETYPKAADMDRDSKGNFLDETCPDCYFVILLGEGIVPNAAEAQRMEECREVIAAFHERRSSP